VTRHLADIGYRTVQKSGHITDTKIENLHIIARAEKVSDSKNAMLFDLR